MMELIWTTFEIETSESCEIIANFSILSLKTDFKLGIDKAVKFIGTVGRGKFVLPI